MAVTLIESAARAKREHEGRWVRDLLRAEVLAGSYPNGVLPPEGALMSEYGCSRATMRAALDLLRAAGLVERLQGTGTFALAERYAMRLVEFHGVDSAPGNDVGLAPDIIDCSTVPMPLAVAEQLNEPIGSPCLRLEYRVMTRGRVLGVCTNYLRYPEAAAVAAAPFVSHWYQLMDAAGLDVASTDLLIEAVLATDAELAALLEVELNAPVLATQQVIRDAAGRPYDFAIIRLRADRIGLLAHQNCYPDAAA